jgi:hypothetical protein
MPQLTNSIETYEKPGLVIRYRLASGVKVFKGALVGLNAAGLIVPLNPLVANLRFVGVACETVEQSEARTAINVTKAGTFLYPSTSSTSVAQIGSVAYAAGDGSVSVSDSGLANDYIIGTVVALETASNGEPGLRIRIDNNTI